LSQHCGEVTVLSSMWAALVAVGAAASAVATPVHPELRALGLIRGTPVAYAGRWVLVRPGLRVVRVYDTASGKMLTRRIGRGCVPAGFSTPHLLVGCGEHAGILNLQTGRRHPLAGFEQLVAESGQADVIPLALGRAWAVAAVQLLSSQGGRNDTAYINLRTGERRIDRPDRPRDADEPSLRPLARHPCPRLTSTSKLVLHRCGGSARTLATCRPVCGMSVLSGGRVAFTTPYRVTLLDLRNGHRRRWRLAARSPSLALTRRVLFVAEAARAGTPLLRLFRVDL
jgi:hypothetical protein